MLSPSWSPHLLVVAEESHFQRFLAQALTEEGYAVQVAASLEGALLWVNSQSFDLVLADLYVGRTPSGQTAAHILRRRVQPTPIGVLFTDPAFTEVAARQAGFAFTLAMPFELDTLLAQVAVALQAPLAPEQAPQERVVTRYFDALAAGAWDALLDLCADEVLCAVPFFTPGASQRTLRGKAALRRSLAETARVYTSAQLIERHLYRRPKGIVAWTTTLWLTPNGAPQRLVGATLFEFTGERIAKLGMQGTWVETRVSKTRTG